MQFLIPSVELICFPGGKKFPCRMFLSLIFRQILGLPLSNPFFRAKQRLIKDSRFENISGTALKLDQETDDYGIYNAEFLTIENSQFRNIGGPVASVYRGGTDESTFGPHVLVSASTFENIGKGEVPLMRLHGVQKAKFTGNTVSQTQAIQFVKTTGHPQLEAADNTIGKGAPTDLFAIDDRRASK